MFELVQKYGKAYYLRAILASAAKLVEVIFDLLVPLVIGHMIDAGVAAHNSMLIYRDAGLLALFTVVGYLFTLICQALAARVSQGFGCDVRENAFKSCLAMNIDTLSSFGVSSALNRLTSDINQIQLSVALAIRQFVRWPFIALGSLIAAAFVDRVLSLVLAAALVLISIIMFVVARKSVPLFLRAQEALDSLIHTTRDLLQGARTIRVFGRQDTMRKSYSTSASELTDTNIKIARLSGSLSPATTLVLNLGIAVTLFFGILRIKGGSLSQGQLVALISYMSNTLLAVIFIANLFAIFIKAEGSAQRISELLNAEEVPAAVEDVPNGGSPVQQEGVLLDLQDVSFAFPHAENPAVEHVSFSLKHGEKLGIMGPTGSGKSILLSLIAGLRKPSSGHIFIYGNDICQMRPQEILNVVSFMPQKSALLKGSLRENLTWRNSTASDKELEGALKLAQADDFVNACKEGLDQQVESGGKNYSGGQRQRLALARALVGAPKLLLLDDPSSSLDAITTNKLRATLGELKDVASIVVSEHIDMVKDCDKILLLHQGKVEALGTHAELLQSSSLYREFYETQLALQELEDKL